MITGTLSQACDLDQMQYGCRIYNAQCRCGYGCSAEYRYNNNEDCKEALRGINLPVNFICDVRNNSVRANVNSQLLLQEECLIFY